MKLYSFNCIVQKNLCEDLNILYLQCPIWQSLATFLLSTWNVATVTEEFNFFFLTVINLKLKSQMWIVGTKLDNVCYRSMENGKTDVDYELRKSSWRMMTLGLEIRSRKKGWHILSEGLNGSSQMLKDDIFGISLETWSKKNLRTSDNNNINGSYLLILQVTY